LYTNAFRVIDAWMSAVEPPLLPWPFPAGCPPVNVMLSTV